ncbi:error-prone DNA polymerase [Agaribacter marinus]|uniref:Error-prone DNA polymerase n=1 Tax=Agaribacter marinus TaxID=1431249 RepID=A0AA37SU21_9ALTE|nr:error-prone DNA polymerase [Agaribacter marinus]GLR69097.1 error-prone DNA polymerase [Agaribacter marinus]
MASSPNHNQDFCHSFAELVCQSNFSFLDAASHPEEMVRQAYFLGYQAIAITDECSMAGVVRAYSEIKNNHLPIKLIVGSKFIFQGQTLVLLCPNRKAYSECCRIITNARRRASKGKYELAEWDLKTIKHCFCLWLPSPKGIKENIEWGKWLKTYFKERLFLVVKRWLTSNEEDKIVTDQTIADSLSLDIIASSCALMHDPGRLPLLQCLQAIKRGCTIAELGKNTLANAEACLRPIHKLNVIFDTEWLSNACLLAAACEFSLSELAYEYPAEIVPQDLTPTEYLRALVEKGIKYRFPEGVSHRIHEIIEKELHLIQTQNYEHFFLTIYDVVQFAKSQNILYQGRGSAANSVVCYCLEITAVDPSQIDVLFERFISKERDEPPDIDVDFEHERREEVIQYIYQKYGRQRTALAATVVSYRFKSALREVGKTLGVSILDLDFFIKNINRRDGALSWQSQLSDLGLDPNSHQAKIFISLVEQLIGFPRHLSQHVGGFVISDGPLYELVPVENAAMPERTVIQWDKDDLESLKLLKVDVLALGMLTAIRKSFDMLREQYEQPCSIPFITKLGDDPQVYARIQRADTIGIFQIESRAQMSMLPRLKPACYYDLVVQIAIVRPGPIQGDMVHPYLRRRDGKEKIDYPSEKVKRVLQRTNGVPIFQEQVIQLAMVAAGFSGGEADQLRRAMATWKKTGELTKFRAKLITGMTERGYESAYAERIFEQITGFGEYGFPESHSASFAVLAYVSSWLKHYYPAVFYVGLLNSLPMGFYSPSQIIQDAKRHNIQILPVCVLASEYDHKLSFIGGNYVIQLGFRLVKGFKQSSSEVITCYRSTTVITNIQQVRNLGLPDTCLQALASADALSKLSDNRYAARWQLLDNVPSLPLLRDTLKEQPAPTYLRQPSLFDELIEDYASTGLSVKQHPIALLLNSRLLPRFTLAAQLQQLPHKSLVSVIGVVSCKQSPGTAAGVTFITLEDHTGNSNVIVWQASARAQKQAYLNAKILQVRGILERGDGDVIHIIAGKLIDLSYRLDELNTKSREFR